MPDLESHPAHRYAAEIISGQVIAGKLVRQSCQKYLDEIEKPPAGLSFDAAAGRRVIRFFRYLKHSKGEWAGETFVLEPWQQFILWNVFGWKREDGTRRFRTAYVEIAKKNGKTPLGAGVGLFMLRADKEGGAEVYAAATKRDQARILWEQADQMVKRSPRLEETIQRFRGNLSVDETASKFEPLGADADTMDGLNVHCGLVDELHAHKSAAVYEALETATASRRQPLMLSLTTAGSDQTSFCFEQHEYAEQVLKGVIRDDSFFSYVAARDKGDAWDDPDVWIKANPNLGVSVKRDALDRAVAAAKDSPRKQNAVRRYRLNEWTRAETRFIDLDRWDAGAGDLMPIEIEALTKGRIGYAGLDLSTTTDISAFMAVFPPEEEDGPFDILARFWIPGEDIEKRERKGRVPYQQWVDEGWLIATDGEVIDYKRLQAEVISLGEDRTFRQIAFDPNNAVVTAVELEEAGFEMVKFVQSYSSYTYPTKEFEKLVISKRLRHGMHPVLRWMVDNVTVKTGPSGNLMPRKPDHKNSHKKIDGVVALIMALDMSLRQEGQVEMPSVYEERGVLTF